MGQPGAKTGNIPSGGRQGINALNLFFTHHSHVLHRHKYSGIFEILQCSYKK